MGGADGVTWVRLVPHEWLAGRAVWRMARLSSDSVSRREAERVHRRATTAQVHDSRMVPQHEEAEQQHARHTVGGVEGTPTDHGTRSGAAATTVEPHEAVVASAYTYVRTGK